MKRAYVRPTMVGERFVANEYVAACGEENKVFKFKCDAPRGQLYYYASFDGTNHKTNIYTYKKEPDFRFFFKIYRNC